MSRTAVPPYPFSAKTPRAAARIAERLRRLVSSRLTRPRRHRQGHVACLRALAPARALTRERQQVVVVVHLHRVPRRRHVPLEHLSPLALHVAPHLALRRQRIAPAEVVADLLPLRLGE